MEDRFNAFFRVLDPGENSTGGGAASAVAGAMAAALVAMVARLSIGKKDMSDPDSYYQEIDAEARRLEQRLFEGSNADAQAFEQVMAAYRLPKESDEQKAARSREIQQALISATQIPLQNAEFCAQVSRLADGLTGRSNKSARSDLECASFLLQAAIKGTFSNAQANITSIKEAAVVAGLSDRMAVIRTMLGGRVG